MLSFAVRSRPSVPELCCAIKHDRGVVADLRPPPRLAVAVDCGGLAQGRQRRQERDRPGAGARFVSRVAGRDVEIDRETARRRVGCTDRSPQRAGAESAVVVTMYVPPVVAMVASAENSDVFPAGSVAVAVTYASPVRDRGSATEKLIVPLESVVTFAKVKKIWPWP